jgi:bacteriocin biosynthesis cyclodehydratase domain-containing protein
MTTLTDRGKRKTAPQRARADRKAGDRGSGPTQRDSKAVLQFAPNFTVYVLPPEDVCLYSEDRKYFLRGALYCAVASAIGAGKSAQQLYRELVPKIPPDKIDEALKRLLDRGFVIPAPRALGGHAAAYWASLGLPPQAAEESLQSCRVRIQALDVEGATELGAALKALGVHVVKSPKGDADLTVTLVNDYLEPRLGELNRQHLAERTSWLLVQPSGIFPLVGPVFSPGKDKNNNSACWMCLAERMVRNREVKGFLDRSVAGKHAARVATSPLARDPFGQGAIQLAAIEIAKAIATDFRTDLTDHIVSLDLPGSTVARHYVARRPQCPVCGRKKLRDPKRAAAPFELAPGGKLVMTSGGYRSVTSRATVERNRKHVSPLTGVVSKLERIDVDLPLNTNYFAVHNFSPPAQSVEMLKSGLNGGSYGKGSTAEQGEASALMEAIERYSGIFQGDEVRAPARFTDFAPGDAILPNEVLMFSDAQIRGDSVLDALGSARKTHRHAPPTATPFDRSAEVEWSPVWSLRDQKFRYLPTSVLYFFYAHPSGYYVPADSNGCAAGNTREEAIIQGFLELVERDSYAIWWYNRLQRPEVDLSQFDDSYIHDLKAQLADTGRRLWVLDVTSDLGIPTYVTIAHWTDEEREYIEFGSGSHFDPRIAALRAMTELSQFIAIGLMGARYPVLESDDGNSGPFRLQDHPYLTPSGSASVRPDFASTFGSLDTREQVMACVNLVKREGLDFLVLDQTRPDIEVPVVRVTVPGMRHFYRRFAPGRLYDVPVKLGWRDKPIAESDVNPLHPMT